MKQRDQPRRAIPYVSRLVLHLLVQEDFERRQYRRLGGCYVIRTTHKTNVHYAIGENAFEGAGHGSIRSARCSNGVKIAQYRLPLKLNVKDSLAWEGVFQLGEVQHDAITFQPGLSSLYQHRTKAVTDVRLSGEWFSGAWTDDEIFQVQTSVG